MPPFVKQFPSGPWKVTIRHRDAHVANNKTLKKAKITPRRHRASFGPSSTSSPSPRYPFDLFEISTVKTCRSICCRQSTIQIPSEHRTNSYLEEHTFSNNRSTNESQPPRNPAMPLQQQQGSLKRKKKIARRT